MPGRRDWRLDAACAAVDPELFFPERGDPAPAAKQICADCPVKADCLSFALAIGEPQGIWGGLSPRQRRPLRRIPMEIVPPATAPGTADRPDAGAAA
jgi:hypothetical protein